MPTIGTRDRIRVRRNRADTVVLAATGFAFAMLAANAWIHALRNRRFLRSLCAHRLFFGLVDEICPARPRNFDHRLHTHGPKAEPESAAILILLRAIR